MSAWSMTRTVFILVIGIVAPFLCLSIDGIGAAPHHPMPHEHHLAELILLDGSTAEDACVDAASLRISHEPGVRLSGDVANWWYPVEAGEPHALVVQPLSISPDTARALLQVYRL